MRRSIAGLALLGGAGGCATTAPLAPDPTLQIAGDWTVVAVDGEPTPGGESYWIQVREQQGTAQFGCNAGSGRLSISDGWLLTDDSWIVTVAGCPHEQPWRRFDRKGWSILGKPMAIERRGTQVRLRNDRGSIDLRTLGALKLAGTRWSVLSVNDQFPPAGGGIQFKADNSFTAHFGCNGMGGDYRQDGAYFRIGSAYATERECLPLGGSTVSPMEFEEAAFKVLRDTPLVERARPGVIRLRSTSGQIMLHREPQTP